MSPGIIIMPWSCGYNNEKVVRYIYIYIYIYIDMYIFIYIYIYIYILTTNCE